MGNWNEKSPTFTNDSPLIKEARISGMWIYQKSTKQWFTPDEFEKFITPVRENKRRQGDGYQDYVIRDPKDGLRDRIAVLEKLHKELQSYTEKLFLHFKM